MALNLSGMMPCVAANPVTYQPLSAPQVKLPVIDNSVEDRTIAEKSQANNPFVITFYQPTYVLPFYYDGLLNPISAANTPSQQELQHTEFNFQFSLKTAVAQNFFNHDNALYFAYTQLSFWQAYNHSAFFRATNYEPEIFFANHIDKPLFDSWSAQFINFGAVHESNGEGGSLERSWNRLYVNGIFSRDNWMVGLKPWYVIHDNTLNHNPDITDYLGHGEALMAYKYHDETFSLQCYNMENGLGKTSVQLSWSFPLTRKLKGYVEFFSGYGQSLIDYNYHTNSFGIGIALNDWI